LEAGSTKQGPIDGFVSGERWERGTCEGGFGRGKSGSEEKDTDEFYMLPRSGVKLLCSEISDLMPKTPAWEADVLPLSYARKSLIYLAKFCSCPPQFCKFGQKFYKFPRVGALFCAFPEPFLYLLRLAL
jgi:hypothetical protein